MSWDAGAYHAGDMEFVLLARSMIRANAGLALISPNGNMCQTKHVVVVCNYRLLCDVICNIRLFRARQVQQRDQSLKISSLIIWHIFSPSLQGPSLPAHHRHPIRIVADKGTPWRICSGCPGASGAPPPLPKQHLKGACHNQYRR